jgi:hypothetical protein
MHFIEDGEQVARFMSALDIYEVLKHNKVIRNM